MDSTTTRCHVTQDLGTSDATTTVAVVSDVTASTEVVEMTSSVTTTASITTTTTSGSLEPGNNHLVIL